MGDPPANSREEWLGDQQDKVASPMDRVKRIGTAVTTLSVGTAVVIGQQGAAWLAAHQAKFPSWGSPVAAVVLFFFTAQAFRIILDLALERLTALRRFLLGDQYVEGVWFDLIFEGASLVSVGHSMIKFADGKLFYGGEDFPLDGSGKGYYRIKLSDFSWPTLEYTYIYETRGGDQQGYGMLQFIERSGPPTKYAGKFVDRSDGKRFTFESFRVLDKAVLKDFEHEKLKEQVILAYLRGEIAEHRNRVPNPTSPGTDGQASSSTQAAHP